MFFYGRNYADISVAHRLRKRRSDKYQLVIVRFANRRSRDLVYGARRQLHTSRPVKTPIYINEHLTKKSDEVFAACRGLWKNERIAATLTWNGSVLIKHLMSNGGQIVKVNEISEIDGL